MTKAALKCDESYFKSSDHHQLFYQSFTVPDPKAVLIFVHGLNEHSGRYENPVKYFREKGYSLYLYDHRGHGKSEGARSHVTHFSEYFDDLDSFVKFVAREEKGHALFLIGHSMGGQIAVNYAARHKTPLAGLVTSSANIEMAVKIPWIKRVVGLNLAKVLPRLPLGNEIDTRLISRDTRVVEAYLKDPLVSPKITVKLAAEIIANQEHIYDLPSKIKLPTLMMHGGHDEICHPDGTRKFFEKLASTDKTLKIYEPCYHELFNELNKEHVFRDMEKWFDERI